MFKRKPKTPCVVGAGLSRFGQPGELQNIPALRFRSQLCPAVPNYRVAVGPALVWAKAAAGYLVHCRGCRGRECSEQGDPWLLCPLSYVLASPCGNSLWLYDTAIKRAVTERLSRHKTEAKCLFGHYTSPLPAEIFSLTAASQLARPVTANCGCWSTVPELSSSHGATTGCSCSGRVEQDMCMWQAPFPAGTGCISPFTCLPPASLDLAGPGGQCCVHMASQMVLKKLQTCALPSLSPLCLGSRQGGT